MSPLIILIAAATRLILIGNGDTTVASTIATARGVTGSLLGTVIPLLPPYLPLLTLVIILFRKPVLAAVVGTAAILVSPAYDSARNGWEYALSTLPNLFTLARHGEWEVLYRDAPSVLACAAAGAIFAVWGVSEVKRHTSDEFLVLAKGALYVAYGMTCAVICTLGLLFTHAVYEVPFRIDSASTIMRRPWLPAEEIHTKNDEKYIGYVISTSDGWFLVLNEHDRSMIYLRSESVVDRRVCTPSTYRAEYRPPLLELRGAQQPVDNVCSAPTTAGEPPVRTDDVKQA